MAVSVRVRVAPSATFVAATEPAPLAFVVLGAVLGGVSAPSVGSAHDPATNAGNAHRIDATTRVRAGPWIGIGVDGIMTRHSP